jgi:hypothetical protein
MAVGDDRRRPPVRRDDAKGREYLAGRARRRAPDVARAIWKAKSASCARALRRCVDEAGNNERLLKRSQERELELLKAENLAQTFDAICGGSKSRTCSSP